MWMWMWMSMWGYVAPEAGSRSSRSPALTSASVSTPDASRPISVALALHRCTIAAMATADERELQINPIVASSVQHNTQVRLRYAHTYTYTYTYTHPYPVLCLPPVIRHVLAVQHTDNRRSRPTSVT